jgi:hypothetical protein
MSTHKSSFQNADTDISLQDNVGAPRKRSVVEQLFPKEFHAKEPIIDDKAAEDGSGNGSGTDLPAYEGEDYDRRKSMIATTAEDLVTRVLDVEDDPNMNPWTFRAMFLGKSLLDVISRRGESHQSAIARVCSHLRNT